MTVRVQFDGGSVPNPGQKYGSYSIDLDGSFEIGRSRFPLGFGTNNEAEFESLLFALRDLNNACERAGVAKSELVISIFTDSTIVRGWIQKLHEFKPSKCKNLRRLAMAERARQCVEALKPFKSFTIEWNSRDRNVEKFGH